MKSVESPTSKNGFDLETPNTKDTQTDLKLYAQIDLSISSIELAFEDNGNQDSKVV